MYDVKIRSSYNINSKILTGLITDNLTTKNINNIQILISNKRSSLVIFQMIEFW